MRPNWLKQLFEEEVEEVEEVRNQQMLQEIHQRALFEEATPIAQEQLDHLNEMDIPIRQKRATYSSKIDRFLTNGIIIVGMLLVAVLLIAFLV